MRSIALWVQLLLFAMTLWLMAPMWGLEWRWALLGFVVTLFLLIGVVWHAFRGRCGMVVWSGFVYDWGGNDASLCVLVVDHDGDHVDYMGHRKQRVTRA